MTESTVKLKQKNKIAEEKARKLAGVEAECKRKRVQISDKSREIEGLREELIRLQVVADKV